MEPNPNETHREPPMETALDALKWSIVSSSAFVITSLVIALAVTILQALKKGGGVGGVTREVGNFAFFMILLEMVDALPEAAVLAQSTINETIGWSFVLSIFALNVVNTSSSALDYMVTSDSKWMHRFLFSILFFSMGMLSYSISVDVYGKFAELFRVHERNNYHLLVLVLGTLLGYSLIILLMKLEHKMREKKKKKTDEEEKGGGGGGVIGGGSGVKEDDSSVLGDVECQGLEKDDCHDTKTRFLIQQATREISGIEQQLKDFQQRAETIEGEVPKSDSLLTPRSTSLQNTSTRLARLKKILTGLKWVDEMNNEAYSSSDEHLLEHSTYVVQTYAEKGLTIVVEEDEEEGESSAEFEEEEEGETKSLLREEKKEATGTKKVCAARRGRRCWRSFLSFWFRQKEFLWRAVRFTFFMTLVFCWSVMLTFGLTFLLRYMTTLKQNFVHYMDSFAEGLSGGAFLSTMSGTMMFRVQYDYLCSQWSSNQSKYIAMLTFVVGIVFSSVVDMIDLD